MPKKFENCAKVAVLGGLTLHDAMDFDSINSRTVTLQFSAKHVDMDVEQINTTNIARIFLDTAIILFGCKTELAAKFTSLMPEKFMGSQ